MTTYEEESELEVTEIVDVEVLSSTVDGIEVSNTVELEVEVTEWTLISDAILIKQETSTPQWLEDIINDAIDWTDTNNRFDDIENTLQILGAGYNNLVIITDDHSVQLETLAAENENMAGLIRDLDLVKLEEDQVIAISERTVSAWIKGGEGAAWFNERIETNASTTAANASAITQLHSQVDDITSDIEIIAKANVTKVQNPDWVDDCDYVANPECEPSDPDVYGNPRWIYSSEAQYQLLVDANGNVAGLDIFACDTNDPNVECETEFSVFADKFRVKANPLQANGDAPFVIDTTTSPAKIAFNGEVTFIAKGNTPADDEIIGTVGEISEKAEEAKTVGSLALGQVHGMAEDNIVSIEEKKSFCKLRIDLQVEYCNAMVTYGKYEYDPLMPPPPADSQKYLHYLIMMDYYNKYTDVIDYLDNMDLGVTIPDKYDCSGSLPDCGDPTSEYPIPDRDVFDNTFNYFFDARANAISDIANMQIDDLGDYDGATIIHGGRIITNTINADRITANTELSSPKITSGSIFSGEIIGSVITGAIIKASYIDPASSLYLTNWTYYHDGTPDPGGVPLLPPTEYEPNFARDDNGDLLPDANGYYRLITTNKVMNEALTTIWRSENGSADVDESNILMTDVYNYDAEQIYAKKVLSNFPVIKILDEDLTLFQIRTKANGYEYGSASSTINFDLNGTNFEIYTYGIKNHHSDCTITEFHTKITKSGATIFESTEQSVDTSINETVNNVDIIINIKHHTGSGAHDCNPYIEIDFILVHKEIQLEYVQKQDILGIINSVHCESAPGSNPNDVSATITLITKRFEIASTDVFGANVVIPKLEDWK